MTKPLFDSTLSFESPIGTINLYARENKLVYVEMCQQPVEETGKSSTLKETKRQLSKYFSGHKTQIDVPVTYDGTAFQVAVWNYLAKLQFGEVTTYGEIAKAIGSPAAVRAVGGAVGANPMPLVIGCHRVLGSHKKITGYSGGKGIETKVQLLQLEQIDFRDQSLNH